MVQPPPGGRSSTSHRPLDASQPAPPPSTAHHAAARDDGGGGNLEIRRAEAERDFQRFVLGDARYGHALAAAAPSGPPSMQHHGHLSAIAAPPGQDGSYQPPVLRTFGSEWVRNPDGGPLLDHNDMPVPVEKMLGSKPLRGDLAQRPGAGSKKFLYLAGDAVTRTLNDVFGFDGWCMEIKGTNREECCKDSKGRYNVHYTATVRITHRRSGAFKEDCGACDSIDKSLGTATAHAMKGAVTDALKRAARHFGEKLGNSVYSDKFTMAQAPMTLKQALDQYEIDRAKSKFGFEKDRKKPAPAAAPSKPAPDAAAAAAAPSDATATSSASASSVVSSSAPSLATAASAAAVGTGGGNGTVPPGATPKHGPLHGRQPPSRSFAPQPAQSGAYGAAVVSNPAASGGGGAPQLQQGQPQHQPYTPAVGQPAAPGPYPGVTPGPSNAYQRANPVTNSQHKTHNPPPTARDGLLSSFSTDLAQFAAGAGLSPLLPQDAAQPASCGGEGVLRDVTHLSANAQPEPSRPSTSRGRGSLGGVSVTTMAMPQQQNQHPQLPLSEGDSAKRPLPADAEGVPGIAKRAAIGASSGAMNPYAR